jgi:hypothetical protein
MAGPTGIIPEDWFTPARRKDVIDLLVQMPLPADSKRVYLLGWAMWVGIKLSSKDYRQVEASGIDNV